MSNHMTSIYVKCHDLYIGQIGLALLLSNHLIERSPTEHPVVVVAGGSAEATTDMSSDPYLEVSSLRANHKKTDTRLILHCIHAHMETTVVACVIQTFFFYFLHTMT